MPTKMELKAQVEELETQVRDLQAELVAALPPVEVEPELVKMFWPHFVDHSLGSNVAAFGLQLTKDPDVDCYFAMVPEDRVDVETSRSGDRFLVAEEIDDYLNEG